MTLRSDTRRVHPATPAEVSLHDNFEVACFRKSCPHHVSSELCRTALPRQYRKFTPAGRTGQSNETSYPCSYPDSAFGTPIHIPKLSPIQ